MGDPATATTNRGAAPRPDPPARRQPADPQPDPPPREEPEAPARERHILENALVIALAVAVAVLVRTFVAQAYWIPSGSMVPQLEVNDRVVVSRLAYHLHSPHRGDIVVFDSPPGVEPPDNLPANPVSRVAHGMAVALGFSQDQTVLIKRVIGLPGEQVWGTGGKVYVDGDLLVEPYIHPGVVTDPFPPVTVPKGDVFVMGDNRGDSRDSRYFGPVPQSSIVGRAIWKVWPPWKASFL